MIEIILTIIFAALIILHTSWIVLLLYPEKDNYANEKKSYPLSIIIPAHNEERFITTTIKNVLSADYHQEKEVLVIDDYSTDRTPEIVREMASLDSRIKIYHTKKHAGKANAINFGLTKTRYNIIVILDADSELKSDALLKIVRPFSDPKTAAVSGVIRAKDNNNPLTWFQDVEYIFSSGWRFVCNKINGTYIFPGFAAFRRQSILKIGGFSHDTFSEDFDIGLQLKKFGYKMEMSTAVIYTRVPETLNGFIRQRIRWGRGTIQVMRKHYGIILNKKYGAVGLYGLPTQIYWYLHGFIYIPIVFYQVFGGYLKYFAAYKNYFSFAVGKYFFSWFSAYGMAETTYNHFAGIWQTDISFYFLVTMFCLYLFYDILVIRKFSRITWKSLLVIFFFFPYSLVSLSLQVSSSFYELRRKKVENKWEKSH